MDYYSGIIRELVTIEFARKIFDAKISKWAIVDNALQPIDKPLNVRLALIDKILETCKAMAIILKW